MKDYTYEYGDYGKHTLRITLQTGEYKGTIAYDIGGNISGLGVLSIDIDDIAMVREFTENNCDFHIRDDWFSMILTNDEGGQLLVGDDYDGLEDYIVALEIVDYKKEE